MAPFGQVDGGGGNADKALDDWRSDPRDHVKLAGFGGNWGSDFGNQQPAHSGRNAGIGRGTMSMTQTIIGGALMVGMGTALLHAVLPSPTPFVIHSLAFVDGVVEQDRTISTNDYAFYAQWATAVINADTQEPVTGCMGSGAFPFRAGRSTKHYYLQDWTGQTDCTLDNLGPGSYYLRGSWQWGEQQASMESPVFEVAQ